MKRRKFINANLLLIPTSMSLSFLGCLSSRSKKALPKILILGDSISIGYTPFVKKGLEGKATVIRPYQGNGKPENCQGTTSGLVNIDRWIGNTDWDIIHFNFGLHDLKHVNEDSGKNSNDPNDPLQASPGQYEENLRFIVEKLKATKARLIYATTTPYPDAGLKPLRDPRMYEEYNRRARKIMVKNNIAINDLEGFVIPRMASLQKPENVHFTEEGSKALAEEVVKYIKSELTEL